MKRLLMVLDTTQGQGLSVELWSILDTMEQHLGAGLAIGRFWTGRF